MKAMDDLFERRFGADGPGLRVRCPGRVNLIGEHIDYNGLPVLPMAIQRAVRMRLRPRDDRRVRVVDVEPAYGERTFEAGPEIEPYPSGDWGNYVKAAVREVARRYGERRGFDAAVASDLQPAAGLSSSSALVIASALGALAAAGRTVPRLELAAALAEGERYVGTRGGGMDQAICLAAREGAAARVEFAPLGVSHLPVPADWRFVVADSGVRAEKAGAARDAYNSRTRECGEALEAVRAALRAADGDGASLAADAGYPELLASRPLERLLGTADRVLAGALRRRFRHVVTEADRVDRASRALEDGDAEAFGRLMTASHRSLRDDYEVSTDELDELVERACGDEGGAYGARLIGAGFGGCVLALVPSERVGHVTAALRDGFYRPRGIAAPEPDRLFAVRPAPGASVRPTATVTAGDRHDSG
ncbi:MAG: galactokinase [Gemmatimonadota bacterium]